MMMIKNAQNQKNTIRKDDQDMKNFKILESILELYGAKKYEYGMEELMKMVEGLEVKKWEPLNLELEDLVLKVERSWDLSDDEVDLLYTQKEELTDKICMFGRAGAVYSLDDLRLYMRDYGISTVETMEDFWNVVKCFIGYDSLEEALNYESGVEDMENIGVAMVAMWNNRTNVIVDGETLEGFDVIVDGETLEGLEKMREVDMLGDALSLEEEEGARVWFGLYEDLKDLRLDFEEFEEFRDWNASRLFVEFEVLERSGVLVYRDILELNWGGDLAKNLKEWNLSTGWFDSLMNKRREEERLAKDFLEELKEWDEFNKLKDETLAESLGWANEQMGKLTVGFYLKDGGLIFAQHHPEKNVVVYGNTQSTGFCLHLGVSDFVEVRELEKVLVFRDGLEMEGAKVLNV